MKKENYKKEEWGGWKIVSDMLDHPDKNGIYPTSKCYQELYEFVVAQKKKVKQQRYKELKEKIEKLPTYAYCGDKEFKKRTNCDCGLFYFIEDVIKLLE